MATELVPVVDLRVLSQDDLAALASASPFAVDPSRYPDADVLPPPRIDRAVFNESAGSRKQTFSRLRLASNPSASSSSTTTTNTPAVDDSENRLIAFHLRRLFANDGSSFPSPPPPPPPSPPPPPPQPPYQPQALTILVPAERSPPPPDPDKEVANPNGVAVDLARLAELVDPYGEEIRRRTAGLGPEAELLGYMNGLEGHWGIQRRRRKFVDAAVFGDHLPRGWKLLLGLKRKERVAWINCHRYVSPKGHQFATCKEVAMYLMSLLGYPEAKTIAVQSNSAVYELSANNSVGFHQQTDSIEEKQSALLFTTVTVSCGETEKQKPLHNNESHTAKNDEECQECNLTFHDQSAYAEHQWSFHQRSAKRCRVDKSVEPLAGKHGDLESQECHRTSEDKPDYFDHVGADAMYQGLRSETLLDRSSLGKAGTQSSLAAVSCRCQEVTGSPQQEKELSAGEPGSEHHNHSIDNSDNHEAHDGTHCNTEEVFAIKPISKLNNIKSPNIHGNGSSKNITCKDGGVVNPTIFENENRDEDQTTNCVMVASKDDEINNDVRIRDVNLNSCLYTISSPVAGANYKTSNALDDANQTSIAVKCFGANFNGDNPSEAENFVNQSSACKAQNFDGQKDAMVYQSNLSMDPISPAQINMDCFTSCSMTSEIKNNGKGCEDNVKEHMVNLQNISSNAAGFDVEAYNNDIFSGAITENSLAQLNYNISGLKADFSSCYSLSELNTLTGGTATDEITVNCKSSFVSGPVNCNEPNDHCTLDFDIKGSMLEAMGRKSDNKLENQYNRGATRCDSLAAPGASGSIDDLMSMQVNFGNLSSLVRSVDVPMGRMIQDQCDLQLGFGGQRQQMFPGFGEHRLASAGPPQFGSMSRHNPVPVSVPIPVSVPVPEPTLMLGYAPQLGSCPQVQLGWDPSLSKMVGGCVVTSVCVWCNNQFQHFGTAAEQQADSVGFICPACKEKISGHLSMLNNGSSL